MKIMRRTNNVHVLQYLSEYYGKNSMLVGRKKREEERERKREKASQTKEEKGERKERIFICNCSMKLSLGSIDELQAK